MMIFDFYRNILKYSSQKNIGFFNELYLSLLTVILVNILTFYDRLSDQLPEDDKKKVWSLVMNVTQEITQSNSANFVDNNKINDEIEKKIDKLVKKLEIVNELLKRMEKVDNNK